MESARELDVEGVAGLARVDVAVEGAAEEREVADEVQDLVPDELVAEAQGPRKDSRVVEDDRVLQASSAGEAPRAHRLDFPGEAERAGRRDPRGELLRPEREGQLLAADDGVRESRSRR